MADSSSSCQEETDPVMDGFAFISALELNFCGTIQRISGALESLKQRKLLNASDTASQVVSTLQEILLKVPDETKRKAVHYMFLHTEFSSRKDLMVDSRLVFLMRQDPFMDMQSLVEYVRQLKLDVHLLDIIENWPCRLSKDLVQVLMEAYEGSSSSLELTSGLLPSLFLKIFKVEAGIHSDEEGVQEVTSLFENRVRGLTSGVLEPRALYHFFTFILACCKVLNGEFDLKKDPFSRDAPEGSPGKCKDFVFECLESVLKGITVDAWLSLAECCLDPGSSRSVQLLVGNLIFEIRSKSRDLGLSPEVRAQLDALQIEPEPHSELDKRVAQFGKAEGCRFVLSYLRDPSCCLPEDYFQFLMDNLKLVEFRPTLVEDSLEVINGKKVEEKVRVQRKKFLVEYCKRPFFPERLAKSLKPNLRTMEKTKGEVIEAFNKMTKESLCEAELMALCLQAPLETIQGILRMIQKSTDLYLYLQKFLDTVKPVLLFRPEPEGMNLLCRALILLFREDLAYDVLWFPPLFRNCLDCVFVKEYLEVLRERFQSGRLKEGVDFLVRLLEWWQLVKEDEDKAFVLVFLSRLLDFLSWDLWTHSEDLEDGKGIAAEVVYRILQKIPFAQGKRWPWVRFEVEKCFPLNQAIFYDFFEPGQWEGSTELHTCLLGYVFTLFPEERERLGGKFQRLCEGKRPDTLLLPFLIEVWPSLTPSQSDHLVKSLWTLQGATPESAWRTLDLFGSALYFLTLKLNEDPDIASCYDKCFRDFLSAIFHLSDLSALAAPSVVRLWRKIVSVLLAMEGLERKKYLLNSPLMFKLTLEKVQGQIRKDIVELVSLLGVNEVTEKIRKNLFPENRTA